MILEAKIGFQCDSAFPRDQMVITPHYFGADPQALADRLKTNFLANTMVAAATPFVIRIYDAQKAPPSYPLATAENVASPRTTNVPREVALCLSYYSTWNRPSYRGRLYIPAGFLGGQLALRPSPTQIDNCKGFVNTLTSGLPSGTNWVVYSRKLAQSNGVDHWWVDDEWDIVRSRGMKAVGRQTGTVP